MNTRSLGLAGTAILLLAAPALAGPSSRAEREATRQLNLEQSRQVQSNAPQIVSRDAAAYAPLNSPPSAAPTARVQAASDMSGPLSSIVRPPVIIASANVRDTSGAIIGAVQRVEVTPQGAPTKVSVALLGAGDKLVVLDADKLKYDAARNEITASVSREQILSGQG